MAFDNERKNVAAKQGLDRASRFDLGGEDGETSVREPFRRVGFSAAECLRARPKLVWHGRGTNPKRADLASRPPFVNGGKGISSLPGGA
jgi:hypothetical protein